MLGWLKIDVDKYIIAYNNLIKMVFSKKLNKLLVSLKGGIKL